MLPVLFAYMDHEQLRKMIESAIVGLVAGDREHVPAISTRDDFTLRQAARFSDRHLAILQDATRFEPVDYRSQPNGGGLGVDLVFAVGDGVAELHAITFDARRFTISKVARWLAANDFATDNVEPATEPPAGRKAGDGGADVRYRQTEIRQDGIDIDKRTVQIAFSSEYPVKRWFGTEILDHKPSSVRLGRLRSGAPLLLNHDYAPLWGGEHIGVHESAHIDAKDKRGRAVVRFSRSARAEEIFVDVQDRIRRHVSTGYIVHKQEVSEVDKNGHAIAFRVTDWEPLENSIVSIPADPDVGVNRDYNLEPEFKPSPQTEDNAMPEKRTPDGDVQTSANDASAAEVDSARTQAAAAERVRIADILETGERFDAMKEAHQAVKDGTDVDDFNRQVLEKMSNVRLTPVLDDAAIGLSDREKQRYSICRAILAQADITGAGWKKAGFERECSLAVADKLGRNPEGFFMPWEIMVEPRQTRILDKATEGADLVATDLQTGNIIELLRNRMVTARVGARMLTGLVGDVAVPRHSGGASAFWVAEATDVSESTPTFDQVALTPKTVGTFIEMTRKLLLQSSLDVENFVRLDIIESLAIELDRVALIGTGAGGEPTGIAATTGIGDVDYGSPNGGAPTWALIVEFETDVAAANADVAALWYLFNAVSRGKMKTTEKATGTAKFLWDVESGATPVNGYGALVTNLLRSNLVKGTLSTGSEAIFGNFNDLLIALWTGTDVIVNPFAKDKQGTLRITVLQDADIGIRHPASFSYSNEIDNA